MTQPLSGKPIPAQFQGSQARGWYEASPSFDNADVSQFLVGRARNLVYCIRDHGSRLAVIIDPHEGAELIARDLKAQGYTLTEIWLTHTHWDHIGGIRACAQVAGARLPVRSHSKELTRLAIASRDPDLLAAPFEWKDGQITTQVDLGTTPVTLHLTPGHSPGEVCYEVPLGEHNAILTGDALFIGDCGRTDLPGGDPKQLWQSLAHLSTLSDHTLVLPGHHYSPPLAAWMGEQKMSNPALNCKTLEEFLALP